MTKKDATSFLPTILAPILRLLGATWRIQVVDHCGMTKKGEGAPPPLIWVLWHNRILVIPILYQRLRHRKGAALISRSKDGAILSGCIERFGGEAIRGSSSRGGSTALAQLKQKIADGYDIYITPDGPRGPRYSVSPGAVWLAQASGAPIMCFGMESSACWRLGRWDGFIIPKPFAKITVTLHPLYSIPPLESEAQFESERERLYEAMMKGTALH